MQLFINCDLFDQSVDHKINECEKCRWCHKTDVSTRLMFGRPNKGPHFKVIHMAVGMISLYEKYSTEQDIENICGKSGKLYLFSDLYISFCYVNIFSFRYRTPQRG